MPYVIIKFLLKQNEEILLGPLTSEEGKPSAF